MAALLLTAIASPTLALCLVDRSKQHPPAPPRSGIPHHCQAPQAPPHSPMSLAAGPKTPKQPRLGTSDIGCVAKLGAGNTEQSPNPSPGCPFSGPGPAVRSSGRKWAVLAIDILSRGEILLRWGRHKLISTQLWPASPIRGAMCCLSQACVGLCFRIVRICPKRSSN